MFRITFIPKTVSISNNNPVDTIGVWYLSQAITLLVFSNWLPHSSSLAFRLFVIITAGSTGYERSTSLSLTLKKNPSIIESAVFIKVHSGLKKLQKQLKSKQSHILSYMLL